MSDKSYFLPVVISVLMHGILLVLVVWGWESAELPKQKMTPRYVEATLVTIKPKTVQQAAPKPKPKVVDMAAKRKEQQRLQQAAEKKRLAQQKAERERLRKLAEEKARKEKEKKAKEQADKERLAKQRQEQERKRQQEQQRQKEAAFNDALKEEEALLAAQEDEVTAQSYVALMAQRIEQNWSRPPSARNGMKCELAIQLIPTGEVINVTVVKSSGNSAFDRAAEQAVKKIGRFDELKKVEPDVFERYFRQVTLVFNPQDLRL
ncbi:cell envelope integrity protein TolA [Aestuariicella hydrocarbonica]|uniref:Cell envelope integrity protein TolA n=1 Tax=Pseudomaricurvus hydrocarbonicus TaxID=1470433 RepID=A0A9E5JPC7_9GAMM|nr:cell envelope integrity protein TolA [Aestuariicella hydrocarbonica]NHO64137.1 cell envelope integrity protein TolA [Aestuariicella hydrocarbonica]